MTVFVCGALVMIYEIIGSRLLSPYLGASTYVWTSLIGVILAALSFGYWFGGKIADRHPALKNLAAIIFFAGGLVSVTILLKDLILSLVASLPFGLEIKSIIAAVLLFAPASVLFGFVTPYAVKIKISSLADSGETVGRIYAFSTVGSIFGTFLAGFFLIPFVGSVKTLYIIGASLFALSILIAPFAVSKVNIAVLVVFFFGIGASEFVAYQQLVVNDLHDIDTEYSRVRVFNAIDRETGKPIRTMATDPFFTQSAVFLDSDELVLEYAKYYQLAGFFKPDLHKALIIGGAGCTFPRAFLQKHPYATIEVAEIDPQMTEIAKKYFRLTDDPRMKITHEDGRTFLNAAAAKNYDVVFMDAFGSMFSVPFQLTTVEAVSQISRVLKDDGVIIFNIGGAITGDSSRFLHAELATYKKVFPRVHFFKINAEYTDDHLQNMIIVAFKSENHTELSSDNPQIARLLAHLYEKPVSEDAPVLTDDLAPVEYYNSFAQSVYSK